MANNCGRWHSHCIGLAAHRKSCLMGVGIMAEFDFNKLKAGDATEVTRLFEILKPFIPFRASRSQDADDLTDECLEAIFGWILRCPDEPTNLLPCCLAIARKTILKHKRHMLPTKSLEKIYIAAIDEGPECRWTAQQTPCWFVRQDIPNGDAALSSAPVVAPQTAHKTGGGNASAKRDVFWQGTFFEPYVRGTRAKSVI
jgi:hypothetical protein